jgi:hypothetical protein
VKTNDLAVQPSQLADSWLVGAIAQFEKASLVAKLKAARDRKRIRDGKCEGRRSHREMNPELVALVKRLRRRNPKPGERRSTLHRCRTRPARASERQRTALCSGVNSSDGSGLS